MYIGGQANADEPSTSHSKSYETSMGPSAATGGNKNMAYITQFLDNKAIAHIYASEIYNACRGFLVDSFLTCSSLKVTVTGRSRLVHASQAETAMLSPTKAMLPPASSDARAKAMLVGAVTLCLAASPATASASRLMAVHRPPSGITVSVLQEVGASNHGRKNN